MLHALFHALAHTRLAVPAAAGKTLVHLAVYLIDAQYLLLREELAVLLVVLLADVEQLLAHGELVLYLLLALGVSLGSLVGVLARSSLRTALRAWRHCFPHFLLVAHVDVGELFCRCLVQSQLLHHVAGLLLCQLLAGQTLALLAVLRTLAWLGWFVVVVGCVIVGRCTYVAYCHCHHSDDEQNVLSHIFSVFLFGLTTLLLVATPIRPRLGIKVKRGRRIFSFAPYFFRVLHAALHGQRTNDGGYGRQYGVDDNAPLLCKSNHSVSFLSLRVTH